jgi:hypothetical protein
MARGLFRPPRGQINDRGGGQETSWGSNPPTPRQIGHCVQIWYIRLTKRHNITSKARMQLNAAI